MTIPDRIKSRKFWLTVATVITLIANSQWGELVALVSVYLGIQGTADVLNQQTSKIQATEADIYEDIDDVDTSTTVSGSSLK